MKSSFLLILLLFTYTVQSQEANEPFFGNRNMQDPLINRIRIADYAGPGKDNHPDVDASEIIGPLMTPFMDIFDVMQQNAKARAYADKVQKDREENPLSHSKSIFEMFEKLQRPTTTTTPQPPLFERLLKPYIEPWQKQLDYFTKDMKLATNSAPTTTTEAPATTPKQSILEKSLAVFFPQLRRTTSPKPITTTGAPQLFDPEMLERLLFSRQKRSIARRTRQVGALSPSLPSVFSDWEKPLLAAANPFTPNPLMAMFTMKPMPEIKPLEGAKAMPIHDPSVLPLFQPQFKLQDPFYNPLYPNRKSKLFDMLAGGEASRVLG